MPSSQPRSRSSSPLRWRDQPSFVSNKGNQVTYKHKALQLCIRSAIFLYGLLAFCFFASLALVQGCVLKRPRREFWEQLASERQRQWNLAEQPTEELKHAFHMLASGCKLHYLTNNLAYVEEENGNVHAEVVQKPNLIIFIHGWPDSCMVWQTAIGRIRASLKNDSSIVAVDLPGFGGSDGLPKYSANQVISALFEFIVAMRRKYVLIDEDGVRNTGKVLIVSHDWGAVCMTQLASRAPQLADRFIFCNSIIIPLALENMVGQTQRSNKLLTTYMRGFPLILGKSLLPKRAMKVAGFVLGQLLSSTYIFIFNLPAPLAFATIQNCNLWLLRVASSAAFGYSSIRHTAEVRSHMAGFLGPDTAILASRTPDGETYGSSVHARARSGRHSESIRYYREGLATRVWRPSEEHAAILHTFETQNFRSRGRTPIADGQKHGSAPPAALNAPATFVFGRKDVALQWLIAVHRIEEYMLGEESHLVVLNETGHWTQLEGMGPAFVVAVVECVLESGGDYESLDRRLEGVDRRENYSLKGWP